MSKSAKPGYGNCRAVETVEKTNRVFSPVPTALGKLAKAREFPTVPTASTARPTRIKSSQKKELIVYKYT